MNTLDKKSRWVFTSWKIPEIKKMKLVLFMVWQKEKCPTTSSFHWQGYIEFNSEYDLRQVKSLFKDKTIHIEPALKSRERNILYCIKTRSFAGNLFFYNGPEDTYSETRQDLESLTIQLN